MAESNPIHIATIAGFDISITEQTRGKKQSTYLVTYGQEVTTCYSEKDAARNIGECVLHALRCEGRIGGNE